MMRSIVRQRTKRRSGLSGALIRTVALVYSVSFSSLTPSTAFTDAFLLHSFSPSPLRTLPLHNNSNNVLFARKKRKKKNAGGNTVAVNRIAYRNFDIIDTLEAGIALKGTEVKSVREGKLNLRDSFVRPNKNGRSCTLFNVHISKCSSVGEYFQHDERRPRDLLVHKRQALKLLQQTEQQSMTVVPLKAYWNDDNKLKLEIALCKGKNVRDKRATIRERDAKRETSRIIKNFRI